MAQILADVYQNVRDPIGRRGARGNGEDDDTEAIQRAINTGRHVLFPQGTVSTFTNEDGSFNHIEVNPYKILGKLKFKHDGQRCTFLAGAILELDSALASVEITGKNQTFIGLRITVGNEEDSNLPASSLGTAIPNPCLLITGADGLLLEDVQVSCGSAATLVRIQDTVGITIQGGQFHGVNEVELSTGLELGDGVKDFSAVALAIDNLGYGVRFEGATESISFVDCTIEQEIVNMVEVRGQVRGLSLLGVHMETGKGHHFIVVQSGGGVYGGSIAACEFGQLATHHREWGAQPGKAVRPRLPATDALNSAPRRVFVIGGAWCGVNVSGCFHNGGSEPASEHAVWELQPTSTVSQSCDQFNVWTDVVVVTGANASALPTLTSDGSGRLTFGAHGILIKASEIGFFGNAPVARPGKYTTEARTARNVLMNDTYSVLATLLADLGRLGLIDCRVR